MAYIVIIDTIDTKIMVYIVIIDTLIMVHVGRYVDCRVGCLICFINFIFHPYSESDNLLNINLVDFPPSVLPKLKLLGNIFPPPMLQSMRVVLDLIQ